MQVEHDVARRQVAIGAALPPAKQGAGAGLELAEIEGFDEIVVGARVERIDAIIDKCARGQDQNGGLDPSGREAREDVETRCHRAD